MYERFSQCYDSCGFDNCARYVSRQILDYLAEDKIHVSSALDIACGTGTLLLELAEEGIEGVGIDLCESMIDQARKKAQAEGADRIEFHVADMVQFGLDRKFELITCTNDAVNHLLDEESVFRLFSNVFSHLSDNGLFIFDMHTIAGLRNWRYRKDHFGDKEVRLWHGVFDEESCVGTAFVDIFLAMHPQHDVYTRHRETIVEKAYPMADVVALLERAKLHHVSCFPSNGEAIFEEMERNVTCQLIARK